MRRLAEWCLRLRGWRFVGEFPSVPKMVVVGAPHTSNWDFLVFLAAISHWKVEPRFVAKHTLFRWPLGGLLRGWGGIPVDRSQPGGLVRSVVEEFRRQEEIILVMAPEGTRRFVPRWKSGFLRIAEATGAPIVPAYLDYDRRVAALGEPIWVGDDIGMVMERLRRFMSMGSGLRRGQAAPVALESGPRKGSP